jgi:L-ornithine N5-oxygenase
MLTLYSVNEIFDPSRVDDVYSQEPGIRAEGLALDKGTNYGVVRLELLEEIYSTLYSYRIQYDTEDNWPQQILSHRTVVGMTDSSRGGRPAVHLRIKDDSGDFCAHGKSKTDILDVDLVIVASGYRREAHESMLQEVQHLRPRNESQQWQINRDYSLQFEEGAVAQDAGIWLQGCNESTHGLSDTLLSILATRGGEMVQSIFNEPAGRQRSSAQHH